ncbi:hypothetical protein QBC47DRAFT_429463 [Echria macrotheca]|uniref:Ricin B lectin domain-containing protein n=1 Tax=Echria macrotheca TaxID=438768 RepID=A0AAJ0BC19_9PEZI|nr:hypothetical protein QBC47DRAFT_429463 [Echria macrotheca]
MATPPASVNQIFALTNAFTGPTKFLGIPSSSGSNAPQMISSSDPVPPSNAQWFLTDANIDTSFPYFYLHTVAAGSGQALDVVNDNGTASVKLHLVDTGRYTGQFWRFDAWGSGSAGGGYRLSNNFTGLDVHLDVYSDTLEAHLAGGDYSGQHWTVRVVGGTGGSGDGSGGAISVSGSGSVSGPTATGGSETVTATATATAGVVAAGDQGGGSGLSGGAIAGIVIGGVAALAFLAGVVAFIVLRRKRDRAGGSSATEQPAGEKMAVVGVADGAGSPPPVYDGGAGYTQQHQGGYGYQAPPAELGSAPVYRRELPDRAY